MNLPIIDMHTHYPTMDSHCAAQWKTADVVARLDRLGVERSVLLTMDWSPRDHVRSNDRLARVCAESDGRLVAFCTVDPADEGAPAEVERCVTQLGCRGVKLHPWAQGFTVMDKGVEALARTTAALGVPILFHDGTPPSATPSQVGLLAERVPDARIILGHGGLMDMWLDAVAASRRYENVYIVLSGTAPIAIFRNAVDLAGAGKIAFGTDTRYELDDEYVSGSRLFRIREIIAGHVNHDQTALAYGTARELLASVVPR